MGYDAPKTISTLTTTPIRLTDLPLGAAARLHEARLNEATRQRLASLGLIDRCQLWLCKTGEPCIVRVRSTRIGFSRAVAEQIFVVPER